MLVQKYSAPPIVPGTVNPKRRENEKETKGKKNDDLIKTNKNKNIKKSDKLYSKLELQIHIQNWCK